MAMPSRASHSTSYLERVKASNEPVQRFHAFRSEEAPEDFGPLLKEVFSNPSYRTLLCPPTHPRRIEELTRHVAPPPVSLERELAWAFAYLSGFSSTLNQFSLLRARFLRGVLADDRLEASNALADLNSNCGTSLWLKKSELSLLALLDDRVGQEALLRGITAGVPQEGMAGFIVRHAKARNDPTVTPQRFRSDVDKELRTWNLDPGLTTYMTYHLLPDIPIAHHCLSEILRHEQRGSVIDYYEGLVHVLRILAATETFVLTPVLSNGLSSLNACMSDDRLETLTCALLEDDDVLWHDAKLDASVENLMRGHHDQASAFVLEALTTTPDSADALMIAARLVATVPSPLPEAPLSFALASRLGRTLAGQATADDIYGLQRHVLNFHGSGSATAVAAGLAHAREAAFEGSQHLVALAAATSPARNAIWLHLLGPCRIRRVIAASHQRSVVSGFAWSAVYLDGGTAVDGICPLEESLIAAQIATERAQWTGVYQWGRALYGACSPYHARRGARAISEALLHQGDTRKAVEHIVSCVLHDPSLVDVLSLSEAVRYVRQVDRPSVWDSMAVAILFDVHAKRVNDTTDFDRVWAIADLLRCFDLQRPSELKTYAASYPRAQYVYFLRYLCVESNLDRTTLFESSRAVMEERRAICRVLLDADPANQQEYHAEIKSISSRLTLRHRMRQVEQNRVYVDIGSVRRTGAATVRDLYDRFHALMRRHDKERLLEEGESGGDGGGSIELARVFLTLLRDEYVFSSEHGLDRYLSIRIRHGALTAALRKPLDMASLVTLRDASCQGYLRNKHWVERLGGDSKDSKEWLERRFDRFSRDYDGLLDEIHSWLRVTREVFGPELFVFRFSTDVTEECRQALATLSFDDCIDAAIKLFDRRLDSNLSMIRTQLRREARPCALRLIEHLEREIVSTISPVDTDFIRAVRRAQTEVKSAFDRVITWFHRTGVASTEPFHIQEVIDISTQSIRTIAPEFHIDLICSPGADTLFHGHQLIPLVDIFFIILQNVVKHSGLQQSSATIAISLVADTLLIRVRSPVRPDLLTTETKSRLDKIKLDLLSGDCHPSAVTREGGTGLCKVARILTHDFHAGALLDFGFTDSNEFVVDLVVPIVRSQHAHSDR